MTRYFRIPKGAEACKVEGGKLHRRMGGGGRWRDGIHWWDDEVCLVPGGARFRDAWERLCKAQEHAEVAIPGGMRNWSRLPPPDGLYWLATVEEECANCAPRSKVMGVHVVCAECDGGQNTRHELWPEDDERLALEFLGNASEEDQYAMLRTWISAHDLAGIRILGGEKDCPACAGRGSGVDVLKEFDHATKCYRCDDTGRVTVEREDVMR